MELTSNDLIKNMNNEIINTCIITYYLEILNYILVQITDNSIIILVFKLFLRFTIKTCYSPYVKPRLVIECILNNFGHT